MSSDNTGADDRRPESTEPEGFGAEGAGPEGVHANTMNANMKTGAEMITDTVLTRETVETADGPFTLVTDAEGRVLASGWSAEPAEILGRISSPRGRSVVPFSLAARPAHEKETDAAAAVRAYYAGDVAAIDAVPVILQGTALQMRGWKALRSIAPGKPLTYTEFAISLGEPRAVRAAASICARNAPALFVPCHRVLRSDGSLGGFAWGLGVKHALLERELATLRAAS